MRMEASAFIPMMILSITVSVSSHQVCIIGSEYDPSQSGNPPRWHLSHEDPCECTALRLGGVNTGVVLTRKEAATSSVKDLILSEDPGDIQTFFTCPASTVECLNPTPLGLKNGAIPDGSITASSTQGSFAASNGRLDYEGFWRPKTSENSWIKVALEESSVVSGVITQGSNTGNDFRVTKYKVSYQKPLSPTYHYVKNVIGDTQVFSGNTGNSQIHVQNFFHKSIEAVRIRIEPVEWNKKVAIRFELLGCPIN